MAVGTSMVVIMVTVVLIVCMVMMVVGGRRVCGSVRVAMVVVMVMTMPVVVAVTVVVSAVERKDTDQVDEKPSSANKKELSRPTDISTSKESFDGLIDDLNADEHQEDAISQACQSVDLSISIREFETRRPLAHNGSTNADE